MSHDNVRGTDFSKLKDRVAIVLVCNAVKYHSFPTSYNGSPKEPRCFWTGRFDTEKLRTRPQKKDWTDSEGLEH